VTGEVIGLVGVAVGGAIALAGSSLVERAKGRREERTRRRGERFDAYVRYLRATTALYSKTLDVHNGVAAGDLTTFGGLLDDVHGVYEEIQLVGPSGPAEAASRLRVEAFSVGMLCRDPADVYGPNVWAQAVEEHHEARDAFLTSCREALGYDPFDNPHWSERSSQ
jgi:hypothetical protein